MKTNIIPKKKHPHSFFFIYCTTCGQTIHLNDTHRQGNLGDNDPPPTTGNKEELKTVKTSFKLVKHY